MIIVGAGMAGLLAANMLRKHNPKIIEKQASLPDNHGALLRFRTQSVSDATGINFKKVKVRKQINYKDKIVDKPTIALCNEYSEKVTGKIEDRSIWNLDPSERYIAPDDFLSSLRLGCDIDFGQDISDHKFFYVNPNTVTIYRSKMSEPIISTMPMHVLMNLLDWRDIPNFEYRTIWSVSFTIYKEVDVYQTTYYPDIGDAMYRSSITGNKFICEFINDPYEIYKKQSIEKDLKRTLRRDYGIYIPDSVIIDMQIKKQKFGKLIPIDNKLRKEFISWATNNFGIYSLGRWATHRQILLDDVVKDVHIIKNLIDSGNYNK